MASVHVQKALLCVFPRTPILTCKAYREFVKTHWPAALKRSSSPRKQLVLQDGNPVQSSMSTNFAYETISWKIFSVPARSPKLNPIENIFNLAYKHCPFLLHFNGR